jgi:succinoglycan biosynthesis protein ExoM
MSMHGSTISVESSRKLELDGTEIAGRSPRHWPTVDICICTYYRLAVLDALRAIAAQSIRPEAPVRIIVADNAPNPEAQDRVLAAAREFELDIVYVHAPANNISIARNACLDKARADWIVFLDDDEVPCENWLKALLEESQRSRWDVVLGPVKAVYPEATPDWLAAGDFHSTQPVWVRGRIETGYTGNVLIRRALVTNFELRFREELGRSGGEDLDFFHRLHAHGGKIGFAPQALAYETIPRDRVTFRWLVKRSFRGGQSHGRHLISRGGRARHIALASAKAAVCGIAAGLLFPQAKRRNRYFMRAALHCGVAARLLGVTEIKLY